MLLLALVLWYVTTVRNTRLARETARVPMSIIDAFGSLTVLASDNLQIVQRSIEEFEYPPNLALDGIRAYPDSQNVTSGIGRQGPVVSQEAPRLSQEARNAITIENDENKWGIDASPNLSFFSRCLQSFLTYTHWCPEGEYIPTHPTIDIYA